MATNEAYAGILCFPLASLITLEQGRLKFDQALIRHVLKDKVLGRNTNDTIAIEEHSHTVHYLGRSIILPPYLFHLFAIFIREGPSLLSCEELESRYAVGMSANNKPLSLEKYISNIHGQLCPERKQEDYPLERIRKSGYQLKERYMNNITIL